MFKKMILGLALVMMAAGVSHAATEDAAHSFHLSEDVKVELERVHSADAVSRGASFAKKPEIAKHITTQESYDQVVRAASAGPDFQAKLEKVMALPAGSREIFLELLSRAHSFAAEAASNVDKTKQPAIDLSLAVLNLSEFTSNDKNERDAVLQIAEIANEMLKSGQADLSTLGRRALDEFKRRDKTGLAGKLSEEKLVSNCAWKLGKAI